MASLPSTGGSPITFVDSSGAQYSIPLTFVTFPSATGAPAVSTWPGWTGSAGPDQTNVTTWVQYLATQGLLIPDILPLPPAAFTITARDAGSSGNDITIQFGNVTPNTATPSATTVDVKVSTTQVYAGLTPVSIATLLGTAPLAGTQPGLAYVSTPLTGVPTDTAMANFTGNPLQFALPGSGGILSPTHDAASEAADAALLQASVTAATASTFTLTLTWTKAETAVPLSGLAAMFAYVITVTPPTGGFVYAPAAHSQITLYGGTDPATIAPNQAEAVIPPG
jgi:hypothetical protein